MADWLMATSHACPHDEGMAEAFTILAPSAQTSTEYSLDAYDLSEAIDSLEEDAPNWRDHCALDDCHGQPLCLAAQPKLRRLPHIYLNSCSTPSGVRQLWGYNDRPPRFLVDHARNGLEVRISPTPGGGVLQGGFKFVSCAVQVRADSSSDTQATGEADFSGENSTFKVQLLGSCLPEEPASRRKYAELCIGLYDTSVDVGGALVEQITTVVWPKRPEKEEAPPSSSVDSSGDLPSIEWASYKRSRSKVLMRHASVGSEVEGSEVEGSEAEGSVEGSEVEPYQSAHRSKRLAHSPAAISQPGSSFETLRSLYRSSELSKVAGTGGTVGLGPWASDVATMADSVSMAESATVSARKGPHDDGAVAEVPHGDGAHADGAHVDGSARLPNGLRATIELTDLVDLLGVCLGLQKEACWALKRAGFTKPSHLSALLCLESEIEMAAKIEDNLARQGLALTAGELISIKGWWRAANEEEESDRPAGGIRRLRLLNYGVQQMLMVGIVHCGITPDRLRASFDKKIKFSMSLDGVLPPNPSERRSELNRLQGLLTGLVPEAEILCERVRSSIILECQCHTDGWELPANLIALESATFGSYMLLPFEANGSAAPRIDGYVLTIHASQATVEALSQLACKQGVSTCGWHECSGRGHSGARGWHECDNSADGCPPLLSVPLLTPTSAAPTPEPQAPPPEPQALTLEPQAPPPEPQAPMADARKARTVDALPLTPVEAVRSEALPPSGLDSGKGKAASTTSRCTGCTDGDVAMVSLCSWEWRSSQAAEHIASMIEQSAVIHPSHTYLEPSALHTMTPHQRERVVKYINELTEDFGLLVQTGGIACNYFDRYIATILSRGAVSKSMMQMVATTCLLLAAKFFDRKLPPLSELEAVHNGTVAAQQFAALEAKILEALDWQLHVPMPHAFVKPLHTLLPKAPVNSRIDERIHFFIDLSVYGYELLQYSNAEISASSLLAAWKFSNEDDAVKEYIGALAQACHTVEVRLVECTNALIQYYQVCFPEAAAAALQHIGFYPLKAAILERTHEEHLRPSPVSVMV